MASVKVVSNPLPSQEAPTETYGNEGPITLRIATGGAGQSGLIRSLAEAFIEYDANHGVFASFSQQHGAASDSKGLAACALPFKVCWIASGTTASFDYLAHNAVDVIITYHAVAEKTAMIQGIADRCEYAWRDHWMLVGPKSNPAKLPVGGHQTIYELFVQIYCAAAATATDQEPVRYLSRYDKSASNICESRIWTTIGQAPWAHPYSKWYHRFLAFPFEALKVASQLGEYTIVDRGTWYSSEEEVNSKLEVFAVGTDHAADPLLNPAHALVGTFGANKSVATAFVDWLIDPEGGQRIIKNFAVNEHILYSPAPRDEKLTTSNMM